MTSFETALQEHLDALRARDIERFAATLSHDDALCVVAPDGTRTTGFAAVRDAHAGWFAAPERWTFEPAERWRFVTDTMGLVLLEVRYRNGPDAQPSRFLLSLAFANEHGTWRFVYDQNTPLAPDREA